MVFLVIVLKLLLIMIKMIDIMINYYLVLYWCNIIKY